MKDLWLVVGFGVGLVSGALLYKHSQDAKTLVNKGEERVKQEIDTLKNNAKQDKSKKQGE